MYVYMRGQVRCRERDMHIFWNDAERKKMLTSSLSSFIILTHQNCVLNAEQSHRIQVRYLLGYRDQLLIRIIYLLNQIFLSGLHAGVVEELNRQYSFQNY